MEVPLVQSGPAICLCLERLLSSDKIQQQNYHELGLRSEVYCNIYVQVF